MVIMAGGAAMAVNPVSFVPHFIWEAVAYGLHGYGALPIIKILCAKYDLEHLSEENKAATKIPDVTIDSFVWRR